MSLIVPRLISCDEAGFTGNNLLNEEQPYFAYASHDLTIEEAQALLAEARACFPVQMPELKARLLLKTATGRRLLEFVTERADGRYLVSLYNKRLALCCKLSEYIYEPVLQRNNKLFYDNNLHRFVAMFLYMHMLATPAKMGLLAQEFEAFLRSLDPSDAPTLLGQPSGEEASDPLGMIRRFVQGYNVVIARETRSLSDSGDHGRWVLDLTTTAVYSHLVEWGRRHPLIEVVCDESKPLMALAENFDAMINRSDHPTLSLMGKERRLTWNMSKPIAFASSAGHAGLQLADLLAGCAAAAPSAAENEAVRTLAARISMHTHEDCIMPDMEVLDFGSDDTAVNLLVLEELAQRADAGEDALDGMAVIYQMARATLPRFRAGAFA